MGDRFGEDESFAELAMPEFARSYNFACWMTQDRAAAENLVQESYTKALKGFSTYQPGTNFRAWLYRILRHTFLTTQAGMRAASNVSAQGGEGSAEPSAPPEEKVLLAKVDPDSLRECLEELPLNLREVILLCDLEQITYKEIGQILGIPATSVMARLFRARSSLRTLLTMPRVAPPPPIDDVPKMPEKEPLVEEEPGPTDEEEAE